MNTQRKFEKKILEHYSDKWFLELLIQPLVLSFLILFIILLVALFLNKCSVDNYLSMLPAAPLVLLVYSLIRCPNYLKNLAFESQQEFDLLAQAKGQTTTNIKKSSIYIFFKVLFIMVLSLNINLMIASVFKMNNINISLICQSILFVLTSVFISTYKNVYLSSFFEKRSKELSELYRPNF